MLYFKLCDIILGEDVSLPKDQMNDLHEVLTSSFFKSVKEVMLTDSLVIFYKDTS